MFGIIFGLPRIGKTAYMVHKLIEASYDTVRINNCKKKIEELNNGGFNLSYPDYIVSCNFNFVARKFGYSPRPANRINPFNLGFSNLFVDTLFLPPYSVIGISEAQKFFNSRNFSLYPDWQSRFYEAHGHNYYDIWVDCQRPELIDINLRQIADVLIEVVNMEIFPDKVVWTLRYIDSLFAYEKYCASGKSDKSLYEEVKEVGDRFELDCYNTRELEPLFYSGHLKQDYDRLNYKETKPTFESFKEYLRDYKDEVPEGFYKKR